MSNIWINVSLGNWHLQIGPDVPFVRLSNNPYVRRPWWLLTVHSFFFYRGKGE